MATGEALLKQDIINDLYKSAQAGLLTLTEDITGTQQEENNFSKVLPYGRYYERYGLSSGLTRSGDWVQDKITKAISDELAPVIKDILKNTPVSEAIVNITNGDTYITMRVVNTGLMEEVETLQKKQYMYRYYSFIWSFCAMLLGIFSTSLITGLFGPVTSLIGIIMSVGGAIGAYIDWKDRNLKDA